MAYKKGDVVMIYEDPLTKEKKEGEARLIKQIKFREQDCSEFWKVEFLDDGLVTHRWLASGKD